MLVLFGVIMFGFWKYRQRRQQENVERIQRELTSLLPPQFVAFDLETTRLNAEKHEINEIGAIRANRDSSTHDTFSCSVRPKT